MGDSDGRSGGPATLAAKTSSRILPAITIRQPDGRLRAVFADPIAVRPNDPADLQRATQAIADAVALTIGRAPEQWYSFKPIWPATAAEAAELEARAERMLGGAPGPSARAAGSPDETERGDTEPPTHAEPTGRADPELAPS